MQTKPFFISQFFRSLAEAMISPFLSVFFLFLGATKSMIGLSSTLPNFANLFSQLFWGVLSESFKRKILIILGGIAWALMWIPIALTKNLLLLLFLLTIQASLSAASAPAWTSLLIRITPSYKIASVQGNLSIIANFASFIGTFLAGLILNSFGFTPFLFYTIAFFGIMSRIPFFTFREHTLIFVDRNFKNMLKNTFNFSRIRKEKELTKLILAITFLNFSVTIASPFLSVYVVENLKGSLINVAIISLIGTLTVIVFSRPWGSVVDRMRKKLVMLACILPISLIPTIYAFSPSVEWIYFYEIIGAMSWVGFNLAAFAHLALILPIEKADSSIAFYNFFVGLGSTFGPLVGGFVSELIGLKNLFILSSILRFLTIVFIEELEEKKTKTKFPTLLFQFFGFAQRFENFVSMYSLVMAETLKQGLNFLKKKVKK
ncbi:MAG: MFS transporter [Candidatus Aenigmatarchaeota archaeon]